MSSAAKNNSEEGELRPRRLQGKELKTPCGPKRGGVFVENRDALFYLEPKPQPSFLLTRKTKLGGGVVPGEKKNPYNFGVFCGGAFNMYP